jgi:hypothetical protein
LPVIVYWLHISWMLDSYNDENSGVADMYVVVWDPRRGFGGGHQAVNDRQRAEQISRVLYRALPDAEIRVLPAHEYGAAAVVERQQRQRRVMRR